MLCEQYGISDNDQVEMWHLQTIGFQQIYDGGYHMQKMWVPKRLKMFSGTSYLSYQQQNLVFLAWLRTGLFSKIGEIIICERHVFILH